MSHRSLLLYFPTLSETRKEHGAKQWESRNPDKPRDRLVSPPPKRTPPGGSLRAAPQEFIFVARKSEPRFPAFRSAFEIPGSGAAVCHAAATPLLPSGAQEKRERQRPPPGRPRAERAPRPCSPGTQPRGRGGPAQPGTHLS